MNSGGSNNVSLKYERYASSGCSDLGIIKLGFVAKIQFLFNFVHFLHNLITTTIITISVIRNHHKTKNVLEQKKRKEENK